MIEAVDALNQVDVFFELDKSSYAVDLPPRGRRSATNTSATAGMRPRRCGGTSLVLIGETGG